MLVLSRRVGEVINVGDNVEVVVVKMSGDRVVLGFRAPSDLPIHRQEVYETIQRKKRSGPGDGKAA